MTNWRERVYNWLEWLLDLIFDWWDELVSPTDEDAVQTWEYIARITKIDGRRRTASFEPHPSMAKALWKVRKRVPEVVMYVLPTEDGLQIVFERRTEYDAKWASKS